ncbi:MAG: Apolipoprotein N-acyltransferase-like protein [Verrucomicrobiales bacterium]|nr:Apolipoprotein N-acyltransferase-like protein [Verrucomicrobiales bacterium]
MTSESSNTDSLSFTEAVLYFVGAITFFHLAFTFTAFSFLIVGFLVCVLRLSRLQSPRRAFYVGLSIGLLSYAPQLGFFWNIFGPAAIPLWLVVSVWLALFLLLTHLAQQRLGKLSAACIIPFLWLGLEYFRSELYYLRFSWFSAGYVFSSPSHGTVFGGLGVYGISFFLVVIAVLLTQRRRSLWLVGTILFVVTIVGEIASHAIPSNNSGPRVSGVQLEFREEDVLASLERVREKYPKTDLYVLSEYTFAEPPPKRIKEWCRAHKTYLIAGGRDEMTTSLFYNTAFVVGPEGEIVFQQVKSVPIQFFKDGLPATKQELWNSPWGKIGICICYDLSYRRVVDNLVAQGAQALIVPTMDVVNWGEYQHELHARIAPMRAAEFRIPIFRVCSSGISQLVDASGAVWARASFPGEGEIISGLLPIERPGRLPLDHWLAPFATGVTGLFILWLAVSRILRKRSQTPQT